MRLTLRETIDFIGSTELRTLNDTVHDPVAMANLINQVLLDIHSRIVIKQEIVTIPVERDKSLYKIDDYIIQE